MSKDLDEVTRLLNLYIEGAGKTLSVLEGKWQITNKTFAHTGGEHA